MLSRVGRFASMAAPSRYMSTIRSTIKVADGATLAYTRFNPGSAATPLLMINGWTLPQDHWGALMTNGLYKIPRFGNREVIIFDNRGVGESSTTAGPYTVTALAEDAAQLLESLGHKRAHLLGMSLGGMIAQQLACDAPEKVASLVLCSTTGGGKLMTAAEKGFARSFFGCFRSWDDLDNVKQLDAARIFIKGVLAPRNRLSNQSSLVERMSVSYLWSGARNADGINAQLAALSWKGGLNLGALQQPTLVVHGTHDQVLPFGNGEALAEAIPNARLVALDGHGHFWPATHESAVRTITRFLLDADAGDLAESYSIEPYALNYL